MEQDQEIRVDYYMLKIKEELKNMHFDDRVNIFDSIHENYCYHCGYELDYTRVCHCTNDS